MNKPKFVLKFFLFLLVLNSVNSFAQNETGPSIAGPSYEVILQVLVASNNSSSGKGAIPKSLSNTVKNLKNLYNFLDYRLETTFLQRTSNSIDYKSLLNDFISSQSNSTPIFAEWSLHGLKNLSASQAGKSLQIDRFRFGARIPVKVDVQTVYESIGITCSRFSLSENEPIVIGSLTTAKPDEMIFLVLTIKLPE